MTEVSARLKSALANRYAVPGAAQLLPFPGYGLGRLLGVSDHGPRARRAWDVEVDPASGVGSRR